jgi:pimeloyl-ACP methyl ester carboxylesterase
MSKTAVLPQGKIAYREFGEGEPLVFVHGLLVDGRLWDGVAERLSATHRCIVPDWPFGSHRIAMNPDADLSPPGFAKLIVAFLDELGLDRVTLVGNDSGGAMSQVTTALYPERVERLVLTNCDMLDKFPPFPFSVLPPLARLPGGGQLIAFPFRIGPIARFTYNQFVVDPISKEQIDSWLDPARKNRDILRDATKLTAGAHKRHTLAAAESLRSFERPVRFVWGTDDGFFKLEHARRLAAMIPDAEIAEIPGAKTFSPIDAPAEVAERIAAFVPAPVSP